MGKSFLVDIQFPPPPSKKTVKPIIPSHPIVLNYIWKNWYYKMNSLIMFFLFRCLKHILMSLNISTTIKTRWCTLVRVVSLIHQAVSNKLLFSELPGNDISQFLLVFVVYLVTCFTHISVFSSNVNVYLTNINVFFYKCARFLHKYDLVLE